MVSSRASGIKLRYIPILIIFYYAVSPFLYLLRELGGENVWVYLILRLPEPILLIATVFALLMSNKWRIDTKIFLICLCGVYGMMLGILWGNSILNVISTSSHFLVGIVLYLYFKSINVYPEDFLRFLRWLLVFSIFSISIVIVSVYAINIIGNDKIYLGLACQVLIILFFYTIWNRRLLPLVLVLALIVLSGKRGVLLSILFVGLFFFWAPVFSGYRKNIVSVVGFLVLMILASFNYSYSLFGELFNKYDINQIASPASFSSGRLDELISAVDYWKQDNFRYIFGSGFGFTYTYNYLEPSSPSVENYKNVHFSLLNPLISFGIPIGSIYILSLLTIFLRAYLSLRRTEYWFMLSLSIPAYFMYSFFVFNIYNEPILWMLIGLASNRLFVRNSSCIKIGAMGPVSNA